MPNEKRLPFYGPILAPEQISAMEDFAGALKIVEPIGKLTTAGESYAHSYVPGETPGPGEMEEGYVDDRVELDKYLFPRLPAAFHKWKIKQYPVEKLRDRYIKVLEATMGNHSIALFYCVWTQDQFEKALNPTFKKRILAAKAQLADRASFIMHRGMGLIKTDADDKALPPTVTAAMAKVVESLNNKEELHRDSGKSFKLIVEGLDRAKSVPRSDPPPSEPPQ